MLGTESEKARLKKLMVDYQEGILINQAVDPPLTLIIQKRTGNAGEEFRIC